MDSSDCAYLLAKALDRNTHLRRLCLDCGPNVYDTAGDLASAVENAKLTHLDLGWTKFEGQSTEIASCLLYAARISPTIQHLEVATLEDMGIEDIANCMNDLESLHLSGDFIEGDVQLLCGGIRSTSTLTVLELDRISGLDAANDFRMLSRALSNNSSLVTLRLGDCGMVDNDVKALLQHWSPDSQIHTLALTNTSIEVEGALLLIQTASSLPVMERLSIKGNTLIGYEGLANIAMVLSTVVLKELNVASCARTRTRHDPIHSEASVVVGGLIAKGMEANTHIVELDVSDNGFDDAGQEELYFYTLRNHFSPWLSDVQLPPTLWCHVFAEYSQNAAFVFHFLQQQPTLWHGCRRG